MNECTNDIGGDLPSLARLAEWERARRLPEASCHRRQSAPHRSALTCCSQIRAFIPLAAQLQDHGTRISWRRSATLIDTALSAPEGDRGEVARANPHRSQVLSARASLHARSRPKVDR